jgi:MYXO-CTERM domain-containing protein
MPLPHARPGAADGFLFAALAMLFVPCGALAADGGLQQPRTVRQILPWEDVNLIGYWPMDGTFADSSGNGNDAVVLEGDAGFSNDAILGQAGLFGGLDALVVPPSASFRGPELSWSVWVKSTLIMNATSNNAHTLFTFLDNGNPYVPAADVRVMQSGKLSFQLNDAGFCESSVGLIAANTWTHVAGTFDGNQLVVYVNGQPQGTLSAPGIQVIFSAEMWIAKLWPDGMPLFNPQFLQGELDELALWSTGLSAAEVQGLYTGITPDAGVPDAGAPDAGVPDAGVPDAGLLPRGAQVGCGCSTSSAPAWLWLLLTLTARAARRGCRRCPDPRARSTSARPWR